MFSALCQEGTLDKSLKISVRKAIIKIIIKYHNVFRGKEFCCLKFGNVKNFFEKKTETGKESDIGNDEWI